MDRSSLTAVDMFPVQVLERTELVSPAVEGRRHGEVLQKSSRTSNALLVCQEKNHGRCVIAERGPLALSRACCLAATHLSIHHRLPFGHAGSRARSSVRLRLPSHASRAISHHPRRPPSLARPPALPLQDAHRKAHWPASLPLDG
jgi:hypothetical protein